MSDDRFALVLFGAVFAVCVVLAAFGMLGHVHERRGLESQRAGFNVQPSVSVPVRVVDDGG